MAWVRYVSSLKRNINCANTDFVNRVPLCSIETYFLAFFGLILCLVDINSNEAFDLVAGSLLLIRRWAFVHARFVKKPVLYPFTDKLPTSFQRAK